MENLSKHQKEIFARAKIIVPIIVTLLVGSLLAWNHYHGGVPVHHLLQRKDLPAISNWWGLLLLPLLAWVTVNSIEKRFAGKRKNASAAAININKIIALFIAGLLTGGAIAFAFINGFQSFLENLPYLLLVLALIIPIFYLEYTLGFVLAMTYSFGAVLPTVFILVLSAVGFLLYKLRKLLFQKLFKQKLANQ